MQARRKLVSSLSGVAWTVCSLLLLSSCLARKRTELTWTWSLSSRETAREEVFWSLAILTVVLLMRRLLMRVFSAGLRSSFHPWAEAGPLKGPRSRWTGIPRYPEHKQGLRLSTYAQGLRLSPYARGLCLLTYAGGLRTLTYARGLRPSTYAQGLRLSTYARGPRLLTYAWELRPSTYARGLRPSTYARGLRPSTYARGLHPSTYARGLRLSTTKKRQHIKVF
jgi:hypothetical protein